MTELVFDVDVNLTTLSEFRTAIRRGHPEITRALNQWAVRYRSFVQERFDRFSKGGGNWPPLKPATIAKRRRGSNTILRDTNTLYSALNPVFKNTPGAIQKKIPFGVRLGFGGRQKHPSGDGVSIADIATFHHFGKGNNPKREIIVSPPSVVLNKMAADMRKALVKIGNGN